MMTSINPMQCIDDMEAPHIRQPHAVEQLQKAIISKGLTRAGSAGEMKLATATIYRWAEAAVIPDSASIQKIYRFLELIGFETEPAPPDEEAFLAGLRRQKRTKRTTEAVAENKALPVKEGLAKLQEDFQQAKNEEEERYKELDAWKKRIIQLEQNWLTTIHVISSRFPDFRDEFNDLIKPA